MLRGRQNDLVSHESVCLSICLSVCLSVCCLSVSGSVGRLWSGPCKATPPPPAQLVVKPMSRPWQSIRGESSTGYWSVLLKPYPAPTCHRLNKTHTDTQPLVTAGCGPASPPERCVGVCCNDYIS